ncbi:MAG: tRNA lysidine(34) synthetase TilS [Anaerolineae bacterium]|nr:tRNA lysidine(34) synthetase TilS [Anaerolineae bacterium]
MDVLAQVRATIDAHDLLPRGSTVVVGVSGGPDSLCLLHVLLRLHAEYNVRLHVAHLDHRLRPESAADAAFVADLATRWSLPHTVGVAEVRRLAAEERRSIEEAARVARYRFLAEVANAVGAPAVAVGHNADDQVETVLMHCLRGAGLEGLRGMRRRAAWPEAATTVCPAPLLIRPLLDVPRTAIEDYCREHSLRPVVDRTNVELMYFRNRIRYELLPTLETYNPRIRELLRRTADGLADDYDCLTRLLRSHWPDLVLAEGPSSIVLLSDAFRQLPPSLQRGALRRSIRVLRRSLRDIGWLHVERARRAALVAPTGTTITLPAGLLLEVGYDRLTVRPAGPPPHPADIPALVGPERRLALPGRTELAPGGWAIEAHVAESCPPIEVAAQPGQLTLCLDADLAGTDLRLRTRRPGDRFQPQGMRGHSKSVKDYMIDARIPRAARAHLPLLESERGILWIVGWRASEVALPRAETRRFLCLRLIPPAQSGQPPEEAQP